MKTRKTASRLFAWTLAFILCFGGSFSYALADGIEEALDTQQQEAASMDGIYDDEAEISESLPEDTVDAEDPLNLENPEEMDVTYAPQPATLEDVQAAIDAYENEYLSALEAEGFLAALEVQKPHWQCEVAVELMPEGWHCELVDWDEDFGAEYYTFFPNPVAMGYGAGYVIEPPTGYGTDISDYFDIIQGSTDDVYSNVAVITEDDTNQYGAMWAKEKLDLTLPFKTEMYLHLGHADGKTGSVADGMTFTMHNDSKGTSAIGGLGEGLGVYKGRKWTSGAGTIQDGTYLRNSLVIEFDTYKNRYSEGGFVNDPQKTGYTSHSALLTPDADKINEEDHKNVFYFNAVQDWIKFEVEWEPDGSSGGLLTYSLGGITNLNNSRTTQQYRIDSVNDVFSGTEVYWGFTGTTGGLSALQAAAITKLPLQKVVAEKTVKNVAGVSINGGEAKVGDTLRYSITVTAEKEITNTGPIVITDVLSPYVQYAGDNVMITTNDDGNPPFEIIPTFEGSTMKIETEHSLLQEGDWLTATFDVIVQDSGLGHTVENAAEVSANNMTEPQHTNSTEVEIPNKSYKVVDENSGAGADGAPVVVGDEITYRIHYGNNSGGVASLTITDELPVGLDYIGSSNGGVYDSNSRTVSWTISGVPDGGSGDVTVTAEVTSEAGASITNKANLEWKTNGEQPKTEEPEVSNPVFPYKIVDASSEAGQNGEPVTVGDEITFKIGYSNSTGVKANLTISDTLDAGLNYLESSGGGVYASGNQTVTWIIDDIEAGESGFVTLIVQVNDKAGLTITNLANLKWESTEGGETKEENPQIELPVKSYKVVDSEAGADGASVVVGDEITYRIHYVNNTGGAASLTITDVLPVGLEYKSHTGDGAYDDEDNKVVWTIGDVPAGEGGDVTLTAKVTADAETYIINKANLEWSTGGEQPQTEDPEVTNPFFPFKIVDKDSAAGVGGEPVTVGDEITFKIGYFNATGEKADLVITDELPTGLEYISNTGGGAYNGTENKVVWEIDGIEANTIGDVTVTAKVTVDAQAEIKNTATLEWYTGDSDPFAKEDVEITVPVKSGKIVDESGTAGKGSAPVAVDDEITYLIHYVNNSGGVADLTITDELSVGIEYQSNTGGGIYNAAENKIVWTISGVPVGESGYVTLTARVTAEAGAYITNKANLEWNTSGEQLQTEEPEVTTPVFPYKIVDASSEAGQNGEPVTMGDEITYKIGYSNSTGKKANLTIKDILDESLEYISNTGGGTYDEVENKVVWTIDDVEAGESGYVTLTVRVNEKADSTILNIASLKWEYTGDGGGNETKEENPQIELPVKSYKMVDEGSVGEGGAPVKAEDVITYRIHYVNNTGGEANLTITDELPVGLEYKSHTGSGAYDDMENKVVWTIDDVAAGESGNVTLTVTVTADAASEIKNAAKLEWDTGGEQPQTEDPEVTNPFFPYKIVAEKSEGGLNGEPVTVGNVVIYKIGYFNSTGEKAKLTITDTLDPGLTYVESSGNGHYEPDDREVIWTIDDVPAGESGFVTLTVRVNEKADATIPNTAHLKWEYTGDDGDETKEENLEIEIPVKSYKVVDEKNSEVVAGVVPVTLGDEIIYRIRYINNTGDMAGLTITDVLPVGLDYIGSSNDSDYDPDSRTITWTIDNVEPGKSGDVTVTATVTAEAGVSITNKAKLKWVNDGGQPQTEEPEVTNPVFPYKIVDVSSAAGVNSVPVNVGDVIIYKIGYSNTTGAKANLTITDELSVGLEHISHSSGGIYNGAKVVWTINGVEADDGGYVTVTAKVTAKVEAFITNKAKLEWYNAGGTLVTEDPEVTNPIAYNVTYDANGGTGSHIDDNIAYEQQYRVQSQSATGITRSGYKFTGWNTAEDGKGISYRAGDDITIKGDVTLYAQWTRNTGGGGGTTDTITYDVIYHANSSLGEADITHSKHSEGDTINVKGSLFTAPVGKEFAGWSTSPDGNVEYTGGNTFRMPATDVHLYAVWKEKNPGTKFPSIDDYEILDEEIPYGFLSFEDHFAYIIGYPDGNIRPQGEITREEVATIFFRLLTRDVRTEFWSETNSFSDVSPDRWSNNAISTLVNVGILKGYPDGAFRPDASITRAELAVIVARFNKEATTEIQEFSDISGHWARNYIMRAALKGWVKGYEDGTFRPDTYIARAEVMTLINRVVDRYVEAKGDMLEDMIKWPDNVESAWYYLDVQEATNSHFFDLKEGSVYETWTELRLAPDWSILERYGAKPGDINY